MDPTWSWKPEMSESEALATIKDAELALNVVLLPWQKRYALDFLQGYDPILMGAKITGKATLNNFMRHLHDTLHEH